MSVKDDRLKYIKSVIKEFKRKGYTEENEGLGYRNGLSEVFGKGNIQTYAKSKQAFEKFKQNVRKERSYQKERRTIIKESSLIKERYKQNVRKQEEELIKEIESLYGEKTRSAQIVFKNRNQFNIRRKDKAEDIKDKVSDAFIKSVTDELILTSDDNKSGYGFKNTKDDDIVKESLDDIKQKMRGDKFAGENMFLLQDYLFGKLIYEKYYGENAEYDTKTHKADSIFWKDISKELSIYYNTLLKAQKNIDDMKGTEAEEIVNSILKRK